MRIDNQHWVEHMLELPDKVVKAAIIKMLQQAIINSLKGNENEENLGKEIELIKHN